ncbi:MAG: hypothetical protein ABWZ40_09390 [Caulobacterales bacterium]
MGRVVAVSATFGLFGMPEMPMFEPTTVGQFGVDACTAALNDPVLESFWARKVSILHARALHYVEMGNLDSALQDMQATHAAAANRSNELAYQRSMGVSAKLFEAALLAKKGSYKEAHALAVQASDVRPYSADIASLSYAIVQTSPEQNADSARVLDRLMSLTPQYWLRAAARDRSGDNQGAADDWARLAASGEFGASDGSAEKMKVNGVTSNPAFVMNAALAAARAGRNEQAQAFLAQFDAISVIPADPLPADGKKEKFQEAEARATRERVRMAIKILKADAENFRAPTEAFIALNAGDPAGAAQKLMARGGFNIPMAPATIDLMTRLSQNPASANLVPPQLPDTFRNAWANTAPKRAARLDLLKFAKALPPMETSGGLNKYQGQYGWGLNPNGFKETTSKASSIRTLEFSGASTVAASEELGLLRIAELSKKEGKGGFLILDERQFKRYQVTSYGGVETSRMPSGFQVYLDFITVDPAALPAQYAKEADRVIKAEAVFADLTPVYLAEKQGAEKQTR